MRLISRLRNVGLACLFLPCVLPAQTDTGELRVTVSDAMGLPVAAASVELVSEVNQYRHSFDADDGGRVIAKRLPFGLYNISARRPGFAATTALVEIRSAIPKEISLSLSVAPAQTAVTVSGNETLLDPHRSNSAFRIGSDALENQPSGLPGRSLSNLVVAEPGWVLEANGILHPRESEYQVQYVMDGIPLTDNRSAAFVADLDAGDVQEMSVMTAGYPAEYGRKLGGVVEVQTARDSSQGFHGKVIGSGGSFDTASGYAQGQYGWGRNTLTVSGATASTDRFLDPPVTENYTNHGTTDDFMGNYERDLSNHDRIGIIFRREQSRFLVPNEQVQQAAGQRQDRTSDETALQFSYTHIFSQNVLGDFRAMGRDITASFWSNPLSTPMIASQDRSYREGYVKGDIAAHHGIHEFKVGVEADFASIREALGYQITDPDQFDPDTPQSFAFRGHSPDREQAVFAQDQIRWKNWTLNAGLRFDHYDLLVNQTAWSPRLGAAYYWRRADVVFRFSYDRVFQTPAFENLLVASSAAVTSLSDQVLRLPVEPSRGNYLEAGFSKALFGKLRIDGTLYRRSASNYADDDLLLNTGVSFPIAFSKANIYGVEVKLEIPRWGPFSGYISYSNSRGNGFLPLTGGLFLGDDAAQAIADTSGVFPVSQDQRNTVRARVRYQATKRIWFAFGGTYDSGLPTEFTGTFEDAAAQYGQDILDRVNFSAGRARPGFTLNTSVGVVLYQKEKKAIRVQADVTNLTNQLNVINFAGLFSGTALAPPRMVSGRVQFEF
jgi:outer membrane cobalamin receptor